MFKNNLKKFRLIAFMEGISYLLLLFIAMPVKYILEEPILVKYVGMGHGILFILFMYFLLVTTIEHKWKLPFIIMAFVASLVPFGTFYLEKKLKVIDK